MGAEYLQPQTPEFSWVIFRVGNLKSLATEKFNIKMRRKLDVSSRERSQVEINRESKHYQHNLQDACINSMRVSISMQRKVHVS
jgi:hypothetical protein